MKHILKIEKGIPLTAPMSERRKGYGKHQLVIAQMETGDSVVVPSKCAANSFTVAMRRLGVKFATRKSASDNTIRIWRLA